VACGHLPDIYPFFQSSALINTSDDVLFESSDNGMDGEAPTGNDEPATRPSVSNQQLVEAMADVIQFRNLYLSLTKKAMMAYEACGKANSVLRLEADLAGLAL